MGVTQEVVEEPLIYVSCLPKKVTERDLYEVFSKLCPIKRVEIVHSADETTNKCNAFVYCYNEEDAQLIGKRKDYLILRKRVNVQKLGRKEEVQEFIEKMRKTRVYIKKLSANISDETLRALFSPFGKILKAYSIFGSKSKRGTKSGYIVYAGTSSIENIPLNGIIYHGRLVEWTSYYSKKRKNNGILSGNLLNLMATNNTGRRINPHDFDTKPQNHSNEVNSKRRERLRLINVNISKSGRDSNLEEFHWVKPTEMKYHRKFRRHFNRRAPNLRLAKARSPSNLSLIWKQFLQSLVVSEATQKAKFLKK